MGFGTISVNRVYARFGLVSRILTSSSRNSHEVLGSVGLRMFSGGKETAENKRNLWIWVLDKFPHHSQPEEMPLPTFRK